MRSSSANCLCRDLYNFPRRSYWLRSLENHDRKERVPVHEYTIEHNHAAEREPLSGVARGAGLGVAARAREMLHTLGNLTLTGYNPEYSDHPLHQEARHARRFQGEPLRLNQCLGTLDTWNEDTIQQRAKRLAARRCRFGRHPCCQPEILATFRVKPEPPAGYTLDDHPNLAPTVHVASFRGIPQGGANRLIVASAKEFLKLYIAYKAETNFVTWCHKRSRCGCRST